MRNDISDDCQTPDPQTAVAPVLDLHLQLLKLSTLVTQPMREQVARPHDISNDDLKVMVCLADRGPSTGQEMSELLAMLPVGTSRSIAHLREKGWVELVSNDADRRKRPVQLSADGWRAYHAIGPSMAAVAEQLYGRLNQRERAQFKRLIDRVLASDLLAQEARDS